MSLKKLMERYPDMEFYKADGFDSAVIGFEIARNRLIYDIDKMVKILVKKDEMSCEEALEFLEFNTFCAHVGSKTPLYIYRN